MRLRRLLPLLTFASTAQAWSGRHLIVRSVHRPLVCGGVARSQIAMGEEAAGAGEETAAEVVPPVPPPAPTKYDVSKLTGSGKDVGGGAGFNQFDPVLSASGFLSRRFGIVGGLGLVGLLAAVEGREIVAAFLDKGPVVGTGELVTTPSGLQYADLMISSSGQSPLPGSIVGFNAVVRIGDKVILDTSNDKPVAFKYGQRPFQNVVCEGLEEGIRGRQDESRWEASLARPPESCATGRDSPTGRAARV